MDPTDVLDPSKLRDLPLVTAADLELSIADDIRTFCRELDGDGSCMALINPRGVCVWTSADAAGDTAKTASAELEGLSAALLAAATNPGVRDVDMENG